MKKLYVIGLLFLLTFINVKAQINRPLTIPRLNGDHGKQYAIDSINFKAYLVTEEAAGWKVYKVDLLNGSSSTLNILANGAINSLYYHNDSLFIGGVFTIVNGNNTAYKYFATYNLKTNALLPGMNPQLDGAVSEISVHKNKLFIAGAFNNVLTIARKKIVSIDFSSLPLTISSVSYPTDLISYLNSNTCTISKMKSYGDVLCFIIDDRILYSFMPYPSGPIAPLYHFNSDPSFGGPEERLFDYQLIGSNMYVAGNFLLNSTDANLINLINSPANMTSPNFGYDKLTAYNFYTGSIQPSFDNVSNLFQASPNVYSSNVNEGILFGCTGFNYRKNKFNLVLSRSDLPTSGRNTIVNTDGSFTNFSNIYFSNVSDPGGTAAYTPYTTLCNAKYFSNIMTVMISQIDYHAGSFYPMTIVEDSLLVQRTGNANVNGFSQSYGPFCKGDTITLKLKKQGNLNGHHWSYSGTGMNILTSNSDSAKVVFNYSASGGNIKIVALDNFNLPTDTFYYPVTFKPVPNINAGANKLITCKNTSVKLTGTTSLTNYSIDWITPSGFTTLDSLTSVSITGTYYSRIKDNITGCFGYDTVLVNIDTIKPTIYFASNNNYTLTCKNNTQLITANSVNALDTIYWNGQPKFASSGSITTTVPGKFYVNCIGSANGCKRIDSVTIFQNVALPPIFNNVAKDSITCIRDSVLLNGSSSVGNVLFWRRPGFSSNDSLANPIYTKLIGFHTLVVRDTISGCKSSLLINVSNSALQPYLTIISHSANITCSQSSINLNASSATPGAILNWEGPGSYTSSNPASISAIGLYTVTATDPSNGCIKSGTVVVNKQNSLILQTSNDTTICNGNNITVSTIPLGGTSPYNYNWQGLGTTNVLSVTPSDTSKYVVTVTDGSGCIGKDSVIINVPDVLSDSIVTFQPCDPNNPNGQIQAFVSGGTPPFLYNLNGGTYQSSNIFTNLNYGTYTLNIKDAIGCSKNSISQISSGSMAPSSDFIVSTNLFQTDTFVVVDITNPKPDTVIWNFPSTFTVINISNPFAPVISCRDTGYYNIQQTAYFGSCQTQFSKTVHITYNDGSYATVYNNNGIQNVTLSPNPNDGQFNLNVTMYKKQTFGIFVTDASGIEKMRLSVKDSDTFSGNIVVPNVTNGTYVLKVISAYDSQYILFVVTQ